MSVKVTLQTKKGKCIRRQYRSHNNAIKGIQRWFDGNQGIAMIYEPNQTPKVYRNASELPMTELNTTVNFYRSREWLALRVEVLANSDKRCAICGASKDNGATLHVDHIKPRAHYPHLALDKSNLQVLCEPCNLGKSDKALSYSK